MIKFNNLRGVIKVNIYNEDKLDGEELAVLRWQYSDEGGFKSALWTAITRADTQNLALLKKGFPDEVGGYLKYSHVSGWFDDVRNKAFNYSYSKEGL